MAIEVARYQFHSWGRKGIAGNILEPDDLGAGTATQIERAMVPVSVDVNGTPVSKNFALVGPGDLTGLMQDMIVRTDPRPGVTDSEPNYLALCEFYDEDFLWRYTPAAVTGEKLRPWIFLLVLKEQEFERTKRAVPLPTILVKDKSVFPPAAETWLWAHVHSHADIPDSELSDYEKFLLSLNTVVNADPDQLYSRLLSPRQLEPNTPYFAFLIPAFETGRLAGLEQKTDTVKAQLASWDENGARGEMPVYYEWFFRTGAEMDFESLVKVLEPRAIDERVGIRDMDASRPGFVRAEDPTQELPGTHPSLIGLEGALRSPTMKPTVFPFPAASNEFQVELQKIVNLPETASADPTKDPIVSVPLYGKNHAKKSATDVVLLDITKTAWVHDLNRDPRTRVAGGFGTRVVQANQDSFMRKAWAQVDRIIEANRKIKLTRFFMSVATQYMVKTVTALPQNTLLALTRPVHKKVKGSPQTIAALLEGSTLPAAVMTGAFRRIARPNGPVVRRMPGAAGWNVGKLVEDLHAGRVNPAPPRPVPGGLFTTANVAAAVTPARLPGWLLWLCRNAGWIAILLLVVLVIVGFVFGAFVLAGVLAAAVAVGYGVAQRVVQAQAASADLLDPVREQASIASIPPRPAFTLRLSDEATTIPPTQGSSGQDSVEAANFRKALNDFSVRMAAEAPVRTRAAFNLQNAYAKVARAINPRVAFPYRLSILVKLPGYLATTEPEKIFPAMAYPDFEDPMYAPLRDISSELLLPNLKLIPPNTISLLETNQKFIESYLVGLNHEMGRELLWREFPTDQRGSYFRQFWDVKGIIQPQEGKSEAEVTEEHKDIDPIHEWGSTSALGSHNKREPGGDASQLVLVIRGDLLKRYPNTVIFAQKAIAPQQSGAEPVIDLSLDAGEFTKQVKFPLYKAEVLPDIKFFGFDLTVEQARGTDPTPGFSDSLGWFFVLQEVPGEPRFGMDIDFDPGSDGLTWDDLSWKSFASPVPFITAGVRPTLSPTDNHPDKWGASSADMAYVLFQKPSMVAVHAQEMLENL